MKTKHIAMIVASVLAVAAVVVLRRKGYMGKYFTIKELCKSDTAKKHGIDNSPSAQAEENLNALIEHVLDPARKSYGAPITVNSGFRCRRLNTLVGGEDDSQHLTGEAADITGGNVKKNRKIFQAIARNGKYDQLIWEKGGQWIHVSWKNDGDNRRQMLSFNGTRYSNINDNWQDVIEA